MDIHYLVTVLVCLYVSLISPHIADFIFIFEGWRSLPDFSEHVRSHRRVNHSPIHRAR